MSRKRADLLRLKKRAETYSSAHITHSGSGDLENNGSLSTVNSVSAQSRYGFNNIKRAQCISWCLQYKRVFFFSELR